MCPVLHDILGASQHRQIVSECCRHTVYTSWQVCSPRSLDCVLFESVFTTKLLCLQGAAITASEGHPAPRTAGSPCKAAPDSTPSSLPDSSPLSQLDSRAPDFFDIGGPGWIGGGPTTASDAAERYLCLPETSASDEMRDDNEKKQEDRDTEGEMRYLWQFKLQCTILFFGNLCVRLVAHNT